MYSQQMEEAVCSLEEELGEEPYSLDYLYL
jgi:hypothetical protein